MRIELITFDLDDTLWPQRELILEADRRMRAWIDDQAPATFTALTPEENRAIRNDVATARPELLTDLSALRIETMTRAFQHCGLPEARARELAGEAFKVFFAARNEVVYYDDVEPMFARLSEREVTLGSLSNGNADPHLTGLHRHVDFHFSSADVGAHKPDPAMFQAALAHSGARADGALHVGDSVEADVLGALGAGYRAVWLNRNDEPPPPELPAEVPVITTLLQVRELI